MAICPQTLAGIALDCSTSQGGIKKAWIADYNTVKATISGDKISAIDTISNFKPYEFRRGTASLTETLTADETTGNNYVTQELSLVFTKKDTAKRIEMAALSIGQLAVILLDNNGKYFYMGADDYVSASAGGSESGTAKGDRNAYTITLKTESATYAYEVDETVLKDLE